VIRSHIEGNTYTSAEIEQVVSESVQQGKSLYYVDENLLLEIAPDVIFTQDVCDVCQIDTSDAARAIFKLPPLRHDGSMMYMTTPSTLLVR
jgi:iron complex transport system substrate-binding protein